MCPPPPLAARVIDRPSFDLTIPHAMKPSVGRMVTSVIVGTSTIARPVGLRDTYARSPSLRKTVQMGALPVEAKESAAPGIQRWLASWAPDLDQALGPNLRYKQE